MTEKYQIIANTIDGRIGCNEFMENPTGDKVVVGILCRIFFSSRYFVSDSHYDDDHVACQSWKAVRGGITHGCWSAMYEHALLSKDYDYFIAVYARVVKFACHFNNWLPADVGL